MSTEEVKNQDKEKKKESPNLYLRLGLTLLIFGLAFLIIIFRSSIKKEIWYLFNKPLENTQVIIELESSEKTQDDAKPIIAADPFFSIVIPKAGVNVKIIQDVDPFNPSEYQKKLTSGVAHALNTSLPGQKGNSFYFAHSSDNFYNSNRYNAVFYLLKKLENEDVFYIIHNKKKYSYKVIEKKFVSAESIEYLNTNTQKSIATLMTCWPPGTDIKRLVVVGELIAL